MSDFLLVLYPIILLTIMFLGSSKLTSADKTTVWSKDQTSMYQSIACIGVILHHLTQKITSYGYINKGPITIFASMGILFTSIFFFFSGYGLITSILNKNDYLNDFLKHRLSTILVPFYVCNIIWIAVSKYVLGLPLVGGLLIKSLLGYVLINGNGWYIVEILFLYVFFYIIFKIVKNKDVAIILLSACSVAIIMYAYYNGHDGMVIGNHWFKGEWWYNSTIIFIMGMIFARYKSIIVEFIDRRYKVLLPSVAAFFVIAFIIEEKTLNRFGYYNISFAISRINGKFITLLSQMLVCILWILLVLLISMRIQINSKILRAIGTVSTEVFLIHGLFIDLILDIRGLNHLVSYFLVISLSIAAAYIIHKIDEPIINLLASWGNNKDYLRDCEPDIIREKREHRINFAKRLIVITIVTIALLSGVISLYRHIIIEPAVCKKAIATINESSIGDVVEFGRYEQDYLIPGHEKVEWIILSKDNDMALLVTRLGLTDDVYYRHHDNVSWHDSDICTRLNEELYPEMFNDKEKTYIIDNPDTGDRLSLLSVKEASELFADDIARQLDISNVALKEGCNINTRSKANSWDMKGYRASWWWLRSDAKAISAPIVTVDGLVQQQGKYVNKPNGAIRPAIWVNIK